MRKKTAINFCIFYQNSTKKNTLLVLPRAQNYRSDLPGAYNNDVYYSLNLFIFFMNEPLSGYFSEPLSVFVICDLINILQNGSIEKS